MIGFDIGGTKCAVSMGEESNGKLLIKDKRKIMTDHSVSAYKMIDRNIQNSGASSACVSLSLC